MNESQRADFLKVLMGVPKGSAIIDSMLGDVEARALALQIKKLLEASGWAAKATMGIRRDAPEGFFMAIKDWNDAPLFATELLKFFDSVGIPVKTKSDPNVPEGAVGIFVGMKP